MKRNFVSWAVLIGLAAVVTVEEKRLSTGAFSAQAAEPASRSLPIFEVDRAWPKVPPQWKLGDRVEHCDRRTGQCLGPASAADAQAGAGRYGRTAGDRVRYSG